MTIRDFELEFRRLYLPLGMYAMRIVDNAEDAEDLVENAFMRIWQNSGREMEIENFKAYAYRAVRNECVSFLRKKKDLADVDDIPEECEDDIDTSERDARIWTAIDRLPDKCRQVFLLSKRDGLSNEQIAQEMDISIKTVKNQMTKANSRLREALSDNHKPFFLPFL